MTRRRTVELADDEVTFLRAALEYLARRAREHPADPELERLMHAPLERELTLIASVESALADAQDFR
jgi:hypothetical protein